MTDEPVPGWSTKPGDLVKITLVGTIGRNSDYAHNVGPILITNGDAYYLRTEDVASLEVLDAGPPGEPGLGSVLLLTPKDGAPWPYIRNSDVWEGRPPGQGRREVTWREIHSGAYEYRIVYSAV